MNTAFSKFIRLASDKERARVYNDVMIKTHADMKVIIERAAARKFKSVD